MPNVAGKSYAYTPAGKKKAKKAAQSLLTKQQRTLPKQVQAQIVKKKMEKA